MKNMRFKSVASRHPLYELFGHVPARAFVDKKSYIDLGRFSYGAISHLILWRNGNFEGCLLRVGDFCEFSADSAILAGGEHSNADLNNFTFSSSPTFQKLLQRNGIDTTHSRKGVTTLGDGVIVSYRSIIMSGVSIGDGVIIGAGAVVVKDCEPYGLYGGVPAVRIKQRTLDKTLEDIKPLGTLRLLDYFSRLPVPKRLFSSEHESHRNQALRLVIRVEYPENFRLGQAYDSAILGVLNSETGESYPLKDGSAFHQYASQIQEIQKGREFEWHPDPLALAIV